MGLIEHSLMTSWRLANLLQTNITSSNSNMQFWIIQLSKKRNHLCDRYHLSLADAIIQFYCAVCVTILMASFPVDLAHASDSIKCFCFVISCREQKVHASKLACDEARRCGVLFPLSPLG